MSLCDHVDPQEKACTLEAVGGDAQQFNSGLILWRAGEPTATLFQHWHQQWRRFERQDQLALVRAIASTGIQVAVLPSSYNTSPRDVRGKPSTYCTAGATRCSGASSVALRRRPLPGGVAGGPAAAANA